MVRHIVMWKLKEENKKENAQLLKEKLYALVGVIPEIVKLEVGIHTKPSDGTFDAVLDSVFNSFDDLEKYQNNPEHIKVSEFCKDVRLERAVVDYEF